MDYSIDLYLEFEEHFFHTRKTDTKSPDKETEIRETASKYRRLLEQNRRTVDAILVNNSEPEGINREFYQELNELTKSEKKPANILLKKFNAEQLLEPYGFNSLNENQKRYINGRPLSHLVRLILPKVYSNETIAMDENIKDKVFKNDFLSEFGQEFIKYMASIETPISEVKDIHNLIIGSEGTNAQIFWTLTPYIYHDLKERKNTPEKCMKKIFNWIKNDLERARGIEDIDVSYITSLSYTDFYYFSTGTSRTLNTEKFGIDELEVLGYDERMPTHLRARLISKVISREL